MWKYSIGRGYEMIMLVTRKSFPNLLYMSLYRISSNSDQMIWIETQTVHYLLGSGLGRGRRKKGKNEWQKCNPKTQKEIQKF